MSNNANGKRISLSQQFFINGSEDSERDNDNRSTGMRVRNRREIGSPLSDITMSMFERVFRRAQVIEDGIVGMPPEIAANFHEVLQSVRNKLEATQQYYESLPGDMHDEETCPDNDHVKQAFFQCQSECYEKLGTLEQDHHYQRHMALHRIE
jgi:hypothetical protein